MIACLGWGSLVWDPRKLPTRGEWFVDGPFLPIEFARQSSDGRVTLVLVPKSFSVVRSLWKPMAVSNLSEARDALGSRECPLSPRPARCVDYWPRGTKNRTAAGAVGRWARSQQIDAVVWTNLAPKFADEDKRLPTAIEVVAYLRGLHGEKRERAEQYVRKTPKQIDTEYRRVIEAELGWACLSPAENRA